jgi:hypothetical protein
MVTSRLQSSLLAQTTLSLLYLSLLIFLSLLAVAVAGLPEVAEVLAALEPVLELLVEGQAPSHHLLLTQIQITQ